MKRALVTGGSGYVGRHLIARLLASGVDVRATTRSNQALEVVRGLGAEPVSWDLERGSIDADVLSKIDTVFHLAAPRRNFNQTTRQTLRSGDPTLATGTQALAVSVSQSEVSRFILASSVAVYGKPWGSVDEDHPCKPTSAYGRVRQAAEMACQKAFSLTSERLSIVRLPETFGPGSPGQLPILSAIAKGQFTIVGTGSAYHHRSTISDVVSGLVATAQSEKAGGEILHVGSEPHTLREFVAFACEALARELRDTPWAQGPALATLKALRASPTLVKRLPSLHATLDYQLRPRPLEMERSLRILGEYQENDFASVVGEAGRTAALIAK